MREFVPPLFPEGTGDASPSPLDQVLALKRWTREILKLPEDTPVSLHELPCADPGCPLLVTTVAIHDGSRRCWRFERPKAAITKVMLHHVLLAS